MQEEVYGTRDRSYSAWHRRNSTSRFIGRNYAQLLALIDLDVSLYVEYDDGTKSPLVLIETAMDVGQPYKTATVTSKLAEMAGLPALVVLYKLSDKDNPFDSNWKDIESFRAKMITPKISEWKIFNPKEYANLLLNLREWQSKKMLRNQQSIRESILITSNSTG